MQSPRHKHPHSDASADSLFGIQIENQYRCYISSIPLKLASKSILSSLCVFGRFGNILNMKFHEKYPRKGRKYKKKLIHQSVTIEFDNIESCKSAISWINSIIFRLNAEQNVYWKSKAMYGLQKYCKSFIYNERCFDKDCDYIHSLCNTNHIISGSKKKIFRGLLYLTIRCQVTF